MEQTLGVSEGDKLRVNTAKSLLGDGKRLYPFLLKMESIIKEEKSNADGSMEKWTTLSSRLSRETTGAETTRADPPMNPLRI